MQTIKINTTTNINVNGKKSHYLQITTEKGTYLLNLRPNQFQALQNILYDTTDTIPRTNTE